MKGPGYLHLALQRGSPFLSSQIPLSLFPSKLWSALMWRILALQLDAWRCASKPANNQYILKRFCRKWEHSIWLLSQHNTINKWESEQLNSWNNMIYGLSNDEWDTFEHKSQQLGFQKLAVLKLDLIHTTAMRPTSAFKGYIELSFVLCMCSNFLRPVDNSYCGMRPPLAERSNTYCAILTCYEYKRFWQSKVRITEAALVATQKDICYVRLIHIYIHTYILAGTRSSVKSPKTIRLVKRCAQQNPDDCFNGNCDANSKVTAMPMRPCIREQ